MFEYEIGQKVLVEKLDKELYPEKKFIWSNKVVTIDSKEKKQNITIYTIAEEESDVKWLSKNFVGAIKFEPIEFGASWVYEKGNKVLIKYDEAEYGYCFGKNRLDRFGTIATISGKTFWEDRFIYTLEGDQESLPWSNNDFIGLIEKIEPLEEKKEEDCNSAMTEESYKMEYWEDDKAVMNKSLKDKDNPQKSLIKKLVDVSLDILKKNSEELTNEDFENLSRISVMIEELSRNFIF